MAVLQAQGTRSTLPRQQLKAQSSKLKAQSSKLKAQSSKLKAALQNAELRNLTRARQKGRNMIMHRRKKKKQPGSYGISTVDLPYARVLTETTAGIRNHANAIALDSWPKEYLGRGACCFPLPLFSVSQIAGNRMQQTGWNINAGIG
jgi:hypothetical protein